MKSIVIVAGLLSIVSYAHAEWNPSGQTSGSIYYNGGNVGFGVTGGPSQILDVLGRLKFSSNGSASSGVWFTGSEGDQKERLVANGKTLVYNFSSFVWWH